MKVRSKLADIDFVFGRFEYRKDHLIVHSDADLDYAVQKNLAGGFGQAGQSCISRSEEHTSELQSR